MVIWWVFIRFDIDTVDIPCAGYRMDGQTIHFEAYKSFAMHILCVRAEDTGFTLPLRAEPVYSVLLRVSRTSVSFFASV